MPEGSITSLAQILGAEIMRVGTWRDSRGRPAVITPQDLADIAAAAPEVGYTPPLKKGHDDSVGARAWGWIHNIRVDGGKLLGDLKDVPESMAAIIRERGYDQLSAEIVPQLERGGKTFKKALWAVAALGAEIPAISGLKPLSELPMFADSTPETLIFTNDQPGGRTMPEIQHPTATGAPPLPVKPDPEVARLRDEAATLKAKSEAQATQLAEQKAGAEAQAAELAALKQQSEAQAAELKQQKEQTTALQVKNREIALTAKLDAWKGPPAFRPFLEALYLTAGESPRTLKFSSEPGKTEDVSLEGVVDKLADKLAGDTAWMIRQLSVIGGTDHYDDPGAEVDSRARKLIAAKPDLDYSVAVTQALNADQGLKTAYAGTG